MHRPRMRWKLGSKEWLRRTVADGRWWSILEEHALQALAQDPGMGLGLMSSAKLKELAVIQCKASKLFDGVSKTYGELEEILGGKSLDAFRRPFEKPNDVPAEPIADVMVAGQTSIGHFGGALRRLIYRSRTEACNFDLIRSAQCLTEQATQKALSVKAGAKPLSNSDYQTAMRGLLNGRMRNHKKESTELQEMLDDKHLKKVWSHLRTSMSSGCPDWQQWLLAPHRLSNSGQGKYELRLPLQDVRVRPLCGYGLNSGSRIPLRAMATTIVATPNQIVRTCGRCWAMRAEEPDVRIRSTRGDRTDLESK